MKPILTPMALCLLLATAPAAAQKSQKLFDGSTFQGWHVVPGGRWAIRNGMLVGKNEQADVRHGLLVTDKTYRDFTLSVQYKAVRGNSGVYFRVQETGDEAGVKGLQAEIDAEKDAGGLYETNGRDWVVQPTPEQVKTWYKPGAWNTMTVTAVGGDITVTVNGKTSARLTQDPGAREGHIALQLHGRQDMEIWLKNIRILVR